MKIIEFKFRIMKIMQIWDFIRDSLNHENHKILFWDNEIYENNKIPYEKYENHEIHSIPMRVNTILKKIELYTRITKFFKIIKFQ